MFLRWARESNKLDKVGSLLVAPELHTSGKKMLGDLSPEMRAIFENGESSPYLNKI